MGGTGRRNYLFVQISNGENLFFQVYLPNKQKFERLRQLQSRVGFPFEVKMIKGELKKMTLQKAINDNNPTATDL